MNQLFNVSNQPAVKVTVTISRRQLWNNFVECWRDMSWDSYEGMDTLKEVADVLLNGEPINKNWQAVRKLFRDGYTVMLLGDAMAHFDVPGNPDNILRKVVITDYDDLHPTCELSVDHEHIIF